MKPQFLKDLRSANLQRVKLWHGEAGVNDWTVEQWLWAIVGEFGEFANVVKKLTRDESGISGNGDLTRDDLVLQLGDEAADVAIYCDLLCARVGVPIVYERPEAHTPLMKCFDVLIQKCLEFESASDIPPPENVKYAVAGLIKALSEFIAFYDLDLQQCITRKFNITSEKNGFHIYLETEETKEQDLQGLIDHLNHVLMRYPTLEEIKLIAKNYGHDIDYVERYFIANILNKMNVVEADTGIG
jgi:NTP pyrophosphatase (non-canonical NTP hydrolase)